MTSVTGGREDCSGTTAANLGNRECRPVRDTASQKDKAGAAWSRQAGAVAQLAGVRSNPSGEPLIIPVLIAPRIRRWRMSPRHQEGAKTKKKPCRIIPAASRLLRNRRCGAIFTLCRRPRLRNFRFDEVAPREVHQGRSGEIVGRSRRWNTLERDVKSLARCHFAKRRHHAFRVGRVRTLCTKRDLALGNVDLPGHACVGFDPQSARKDNCRKNLFKASQEFVGRLTQDLGRTAARTCNQVTGIAEPISDNLQFRVVNHDPAPGFSSGIVRFIPMHPMTGLSMSSHQ